jgi:hypothetical protein
MQRHKAALFAVGAAFACSLAMNVVLYTDASRATEPAAGSATSSGAANEAGGSAAPAPASATAAATEAALRAELEKCRQASWKVVSEAIKLGAAAKAERETEIKKDEPAETSDSSFEQQQRSLCAIAEYHLRLQLHLQKANFVAGMQQVGSDEWLELDLEHKMAGLNERFSLSSSDVERLQTGYEALLSDHSPTLQKLVQDEDWAGMVEQSQSFWREEDKLIGDLLGHERRARYRADQLRTRSAIMAIVSTFAGMKWDESIAW